MFEINEKVALVTGGASGIGLETAKEFLLDGAKGVTIADINVETGAEIVNQLGDQFGRERVIFVTTDTSNKESFKIAFETTIKTFGSIDILINNAGILDDKNYEKQIAINFTGVAHGLTLALDDYVAKHKSGAEGVVLNVASITGTQVHPYLPIYGATKSGIVSLTLAFGDSLYYNRTKVKVAAIAPGYTTTNLSARGADMFYNADLAMREINKFEFQSVSTVAKNIIKIVKEKPSGTVWISENEKDIVEYIPTIPTYKCDS